MPLTLALEYTPRCRQPDMPFTESSFVRKTAPIECEIGEIGVALVDLWNFGWPDGPVGESLGPELSTERGRSHADRKRRITEEKIAPAVRELRSLGVQIFHCNHARFLGQYPQWLASTTEEERDSLQPKEETPSAHRAENEREEAECWPPREWARRWREERNEQIWGMKEWGGVLGKEVYPKAALPEPVRPEGEDLLVFSREQFHRLLTARRIRLLFYMGFETDECVMYSGYGLANMQIFGYLCTVVRDCTATYEVSETLEGLWKTRLAILDLESRFGYSVTSDALLHALRGPGLRGAG